MNVALETFWARYGKSEYEQTAFYKALARLPVISPAGPWIAGGSVRRLIAELPQESDFDFFFASEEQFNAFCEDMKTCEGIRSSENDFNVTFTVPKSEAGPELKVQAIRLTYHPTLRDTIEAFDFSLCKFGFDGTNLEFGQWSLFDLANKKLVPDRISYGTSTLRRIIKYTRQGYTICSGGLANILQQVVDNPAIIQSEVEYVD